VSARRVGQLVRGAGDDPHFMSGVEQFGDEPAADVSGGAEEHASHD
jgi:hypothetical protein